MLPDEWRCVWVFNFRSNNFARPFQVQVVCVSRRTRRSLLETVTGVQIEKPLTHISKNVRKIEPWGEDFYLDGLLDSIAQILDKNCITHLNCSGVDVANVSSFARRSGFRNVHYLSLSSLDYTDQEECENFFRTHDFCYITHLDVSYNDNLEEKNWIALASNPSTKNIVWLDLTDCDLDDWSRDIFLHSPLFCGLKTLKVRADTVLERKLEERLPPNVQVSKSTG